MVLIDTSAWIDYSKDVLPVADKVEDLIMRHEVVLCPIVWTEFLQGIGSDKSLEEMKEFLSGFKMLDNDIMEVAEKAVSIYRTLRKSGVTIRNSNDCMIAAYAMLNGIPLLHNDRDFEFMAEGLPLELY